MTVGRHSVSFMIKNSGQVLDEAAKRDVVLQGRDRPDLFLAPLDREEAVRDSLGAVGRILAEALRDDRLRDRMVEIVSVALPWTAWLPAGDRGKFLAEFSTSIVACQETGYFEPLVRLLRSWAATAEIHHDPDLAALFATDEQGPSVLLTRPTARSRARRGA
jgi:hypothetical protein